MLDPNEFDTSNTLLFVIACLLAVYVVAGGVAIP